MRVRVFLTSRSTRFFARSPRRSNFLRSVVTCFCRRLTSRSALRRVRYFFAVSATFSAAVRAAPTVTRAGRWAWSTSSWTWNVSAFAACLAAAVALACAARWLRVLAEALPRAARCAAVVLRVLLVLLVRRRVLLLRRRVVLLLVDISISSSRSCLLGILLELIPLSTVQ